MATGNWGLKNNLNRQGVSQVLNRLTYTSTISHLQGRVSTPIDASGKLIPLVNCIILRGDIFVHLKHRKELRLVS